MDTSKKAVFTYSRHDSDFALKLANDLREAGASIWIDQLDILPGQLWDSKIQQALERCEDLIVLTSPQAIVSNNVLDEISYALEEGKRIIPIKVVECKIPFRLRRFQYIDFTKNYEKAFSNLLNTLNLTNRSPKEYPINMPPVSSKETKDFNRQSTESITSITEEPTGAKSEVEGKIYTKKSVETNEIKPESNVPLEIFTEKNIEEPNSQNTKLFDQENLSIEARIDQKRTQVTTRKNHKVDYLIFFFFGGVALIILIAIVLVKCPASAQLQVFQIILAVAIGGLATGVPGFLDVPYKGWIRAGSGLGVFFLMLFIKPNPPISDECFFTVKVYLRTLDNDFSAFENVEVNLIVGSYKLEEIRVSNNGRVWFDNIPRQYLNDSIKLIPIDKKLKVVAQNYYFGSDSPEITFFLTRIKDSTSVSGFVYDSKQKTVPGVDIIFDSKYRAKSDTNGYYNVKLPFEVGESVRLQVIMNQTVVKDHNQYVNKSIDILLN